MGLFVSWPTTLPRCVACYESPPLIMAQLVVMALLVVGFTSQYWVLGLGDPDLLSLGWYASFTGSPATTGSLLYQIGGVLNYIFIQCRL